jgi:MinD superfamily P-loop ATPase
MTMQLSIRKQIGSTSYTFLVEGKNLFDMVLEAEKLSFGNVKECGLCKSESLYLTAYETKDEGYKYVKIVCSNCKASVTFGQPKKSPDTFYLRKADDGKLEWKTYEPKASTGEKL